jgi:hypothetical protein
MDCYNVSLYGFFFFIFMNFFFKIIFVDFIFFHIELVENFVSFKKKHCGLLQYFPTWFLFCYSVSSHVFFKLSLLNFFYNIELVKNLALTFPTYFIFHLFSFFFLLFFPKLSSFFIIFFRIVFVDFIFLILSWLKI